jgi:hypothetical protein
VSSYCPNTIDASSRTACSKSVDNSRSCFSSVVSCTRLGCNSRVLWSFTNSCACRSASTAETPNRPWLMVTHCLAVRAGRWTGLGVGHFSTCWQLFKSSVCVPLLRRNAGKRAEFIPFDSRQTVNVTNVTFYNLQPIRYTARERESKPCQPPSAKPLPNGRTDFTS